MKVLRHLAKHPPSYASQIAADLKLDLPAVLGALRGRGHRYTTSLSLKTLGLVQEVLGSRPARNVRLYEATELGRSAAEWVNEGG